MSVVIAYEDAGPCRKEIKIEVPAPAVDAEAGRVVSELRREVKIQGFRKGKVPEGMIRSRFKDDIEKQVVERLIPRYWRQAQAEKSLDPLLPPEIKDVEIRRGEPMTFVAAVEVRPHIDLALDAELDLPEIDAEPTAAEVDSAVDEVLRRNAEWHPVERAAAVGDRVKGSILVTAIDGAAPAEPAEASELDVELGDGRVWEQLDLALTGISAGRKTDFTRKEGEGEEAREIRYAVEAEEVLERDLPAFDDAFAASVGDFESADALRTVIADQIRGNKSEQSRQDRRRALLEQLRERHPLELPQRLVDQTVEEMLHRQLSMMMQQGFDPSSANLDFQALAAQIRPEAEKRVHDRLVLDAVVAEQGIKVDEKAFESLLAHLAAQQSRSTLALRQELSDNGRMPDLRAQFQRDQAVRAFLGEKDEHAGEVDDEPAAADQHADADEAVGEDE